MNPFENTRWELDATESRAEFRARTFWGLVGVRGHFGRLAGAVESDGRLSLVIDAASVDTGNPQRDRHLRSADFFDVERHPQVRFSSGGFDELGRVAGSLEAAGQRVQIELTPCVSRVDDDELAVEAETTIDQRQLGMTYRRFGVRVPATVAVHAVLKRA